MMLAKRFTKRSNVHDSRARSTLFIDISNIAHHDGKTGLERVTKELTRNLILEPPKGWRCKPIHWNGQGFIHAETISKRTLGIPNGTRNHRIRAYPGDIYLNFEFSKDLVAKAYKELRKMRQAGVGLCFTVHDIIPITHPQYCTPGYDAEMRAWLNRIRTLSDAILCVSEHTKHELTRFYAQRSPQLTHIHLGADFATQPIGWIERRRLSSLRRSRRPRAISVGTIEARKRHDLILDAFEILWNRYDAELVLIGKPGWMNEKLIARLRKHPERNKRLFWFERASDGFVRKAYEASTLLIAASEEEGFGLPVIEAAYSNTAVLARDIPIFRETTSSHASYFTTQNPEELSAIIEEHLEHPNKQLIPTKTWRESANSVIHALSELGLLTQEDIKS